MSLIKLQQQLQETFEIWKTTYLLIHSKPQKRQYDIHASQWWKKTRLVWYVIVGCLMIAAGSRTAWGFYVTNQAEGFKSFAGILAVITVVGVEGLIAFHGLNHDRKIPSQMTNIEKVIESIIPTSSVLAGLFVSALSGLKFSINIAESISSRWGGTVDSWLSIFMGAGLTFLLYGFSEFTGRKKWNNENIPLILQTEYEQEIKEYDLKMQQDWKSSPDYLSIMGNKEVEAAVIEAEKRNASYGIRDHVKKKRDLELEIERQKAQAEIESFKEGSTKIRTNSYEFEKSKSSLVREYLDNYKNGNPLDIPIGEIQNWISEKYGDDAVPAESTISEARTRWINSNV